MGIGVNLDRPGIVYGLLRSIAERRLVIAFIF